MPITLEYMTLGATAGGGTWLCIRLAGDSAWLRDVLSGVNFYRHSGEWFAKYSELAPMFIRGARLAPTYEGGAWYMKRLAADWFDSFWNGIYKIAGPDGAVDELSLPDKVRPRRVGEIFLARARKAETLGGTGAAVGYIDAAALVDVPVGSAARAVDPALFKGWLKTLRLARGSLASPSDGTVVALARLEGVIGNRFIATAMVPASDFDGTQRRLLRLAAAAQPQSLGRVFEADYDYGGATADASTDVEIGEILAPLLRESDWSANLDWAVFRKRIKPPYLPTSFILKSQARKKTPG